MPLGAPSENAFASTPRSTYVHSGTTYTLEENMKPKANVLPLVALLTGLLLVALA